MNWDEMKAAARGMGAEEIQAGLVGLASDARFPAVVALIEQHRDQYVEAGCQQAMAADAGKQAHCWGSVYALQELEGVLRQVLTPRKS